MNKNVARRRDSTAAARRPMPTTRRNLGRRHSSPSARPQRQRRRNRFPLGADVMAIIRINAKQRLGLDRLYRRWAEEDWSLGVMLALPQWRVAGTDIEYVNVHHDFVRFLHEQGFRFHEL